MKPTSVQNKFCYFLNFRKQEAKNCRQLLDRHDKCMIVFSSSVEPQLLPESLEIMPTLFACLLKKTVTRNNCDDRTYTVCTINKGTFVISGSYLKHHELTSFWTTRSFVKPPTYETTYELLNESNNQHHLLLISFHIAHSTSNRWSYVFHDLNKKLAYLFNIPLILNAKGMSD